MAVTQLPKEIRLPLDDGVQVEAADVQNVAQRHIAEAHFLYAGAAIDGDQTPAQRGQFILADQVRLRQQDAVGKAHLLLRLPVQSQLLLRMARIDHRQDGVQQIALADGWLGKEGLRHGTGCGQARRFDDDVIKRDRSGAAPGVQFSQDADQVAPHAAADAAIVHFHDLLAAVLHQQAVVDAFGGEFVFDHGDAQAVIALQYALEQGGFPAAEKARDDGDGDRFCHGAFLFKRDLRVLPSAAIAGTGRTAGARRPCPGPFPSH